MGFTDMMGSARGPGVIGMLLALVVVLGFGVLFIFAFDEGLQGGGRTIESVIKSQAEEIINQQASIAAAEVELAHLPDRRRVEEELKTTTRELSITINQVAGLQEVIAGIDEQIAAKLAEFAVYKDEYREFARRQAVGEKLDELQTADGTTYTGVEIRQVDAVGILVRHTDGQQRIPFENLSAEIQDRFQFDPNQKVDVLADENARRAEMERAAIAAEVTVGEIQEAQREKDRERVRQENLQLLAAKEKQLAAAQAALITLERDKAAAEQAAAAARAAGRQHINRSGNIARSISSKQNEIKTLTADISRLKAGS